VTDGGLLWEDKRQKDKDKNELFVPDHLVGVYDVLLTSLHSSGCQYLRFDFCPVTFVFYLL
jgi:hypothetical protein